MRQQAEKEMVEAPKRAATCHRRHCEPNDKQCKGLYWAETDAVKAGRIATGPGRGARAVLKVGADFLKRVNPDARVLISDPSWKTTARCSNRRLPGRQLPLLRRARRGLNVERHAHFALNGAAPARSSCCTPAATTPGYDITPEQWSRSSATSSCRGLVPFLDMAYQGFGEGIAGRRRCRRRCS